MESWDEDGLLARLRATLDTGKLSRRKKLSLYANSLLAMAGSIAFWDGVYTICEEDVWDNTLRYNMLCAVLGGVGIVWVTISEEDEDEEDEEEDQARNTGGSTGTGDVDAEQYDLSICLEGGTIDVNDITEHDTSPNLNYSMDVDGVGGRGGADTTPAGANALEPMARARLYAKGMFGNVCAVVFWKGVENVILLKSPESAWSGLVVYAAGVVALLGIGRWMENCGLVDSKAENLSEHPASGNSSKKDQAALGDEASKKYMGCLSRSLRVPEWIITTVELTAVVAAWTGVEMYIWDGDYISMPRYRDICYIIGGLAVLLATTFLNLSAAPLGGVARTKLDLTSLLPPPPTALSSPCPPPTSHRSDGNKHVQQKSEMVMTPSAVVMLSRSGSYLHVWSTSASSLAQANRASTKFVEGLMQEEQAEPARRGRLPVVDFENDAVVNGVRSLFNRMVGLSELVVLRVLMF